MKPHLCPRCHGERVLAFVMNPESTAASTRSRTCPTCKGEGVIWEKELADAIKHGADDTLAKGASK